MILLVILPWGWLPPFVLIVFAPRREHGWMQWAVTICMIVLLGYDSIMMVQDLRQYHAHQLEPPGSSVV